MSLNLTNCIHAVGKCYEGELLVGSNSIDSITNPELGAYIVTLTESISIASRAVFITSVNNTVGIFLAYTDINPISFTITVIDFTASPVSAAEGNFDILVLRLF